MGSDRDAARDVETIGGSWRGIRPRDYSHLAIRPFDIGDCGRRRFFRKLEQFRRGFVEGGGVSGQFCGVLPEPDLYTPGMLDTVQLISSELERLAEELRGEAGRCDRIAAGIRVHLEACAAIRAPDQPPLPVPRRDPGPRPDRQVSPPNPGGDD